MIQQAGESMSCSLLEHGLASLGAPSLRSKRILVSDSDQEIRRTAHELLGPCGCIVETARDGPETTVAGQSKTSISGSKTERLTKM